MILWQATIPGRPPSKKNSRDHVARTNPKTGKPYVMPIPNKPYREWEAAFVAEVFRHYRGKPPKISQPVWAEVCFYEHPRQRGDLGGYFDALCDGLQAAGILTNDRLIRGSLLHPIQRDRDQPRIVVTLTPLDTRK